jgi:heme/copper-type cytochrome/quinol oxidase subunit 4
MAIGWLQHAPLSLHFDQQRSGKRMGIWLLIIGVHAAAIVFGGAIWIFFKQNKDLL